MVKQSRSSKPSPSAIFSSFGNGASKTSEVNTYPTRTWSPMTEIRCFGEFEMYVAGKYYLYKTIASESLN
jgi:hypothetical protein